jgi:hypothetical protein
MSLGAVVQVIVRYALNGDVGGRLGGRLRPILEGAGLVRTGTGTYRGDITESLMRHTMQDFWRELASYTEAAHLDHFWMYVDNPVPI